MRKSKRESPEAAGTFGIKEMARQLGISIGTVDRALHGRAGISPVTRARVLELAEAVGYRPNLAARQLKSRKKLTVEVILPEHIAFFYNSIRDGVREGASPFASTLQVEFSSHPRLGEGDTEPLERALEQRRNGVVICPGDPVKINPLIHRAAALGIPVVCVVSDAPDSERLTAVTADANTVGAMVGELFSRFFPGSGACAVITGDLTTVDHREKVTGFRNSLAEYGGGLELVSVAEAHDDEQEGYRQARSILAARRDLKALYISTGNSLPVLHALQECGMAGKVALITSDLFDELVPYIRSGVVLGTVYQRPNTQGVRAIQALYRYVAEGVRPAEHIRLAPHIVMRSNLDLILGLQPRDNL